MSQLNIKGLVDNIKQRTSVYSPIIEAIVNSMQAIDDSARKDGEIIVTVRRDKQQQLDIEDNALPEITGILVQDNGIGFNAENRDSFDTLYSDLRIDDGGKGFGRFIFLKYFQSVNVESTFKNSEKFSYRTFDFGTNSEIIENESIIESNKTDSQTILFLNGIKERKLDKKLDTLARKLTEKLLIYFINDKYLCPKIILRDEDEKNRIVLNDYLSSEGAEIQEVTTREFSLKRGNESKQFQVKIFKIFFPHNQKSRISLTAHNREVTETLLNEYVPEFEDDFYEETQNEDKTTRKDYVIKTYVLSDYLDENVSLERVAFDFSAQNDLFYAFSQEEIEEEAAKITKEVFPEEINLRQNKKNNRINNYVNSEAPWHKPYLNDLDLTSMPYKLSDERIDAELHKVKFQQERNAKINVKKILDDPSTKNMETANVIIEQISKAEMSQLAHYVALRKAVLSLFKKSLEIKEDGAYNLESIVHNIIFPTSSDSDSTPYNKHNLWIIDEKLNFTDYISSDKKLNETVKDRPDLLIFNKKIAFRGENVESNPITIFEFKKPQREDFADPSSKDDPVNQIIRYVNEIKARKHKTQKGRDINIAENTPFYGFVVCDLTKKVTDWLFSVKDFKQMPDGKGWFKWFDNNNLYLEVISWDKVLLDAEMRNKIFFQKLGIE